MKINNSVNKSKIGIVIHTIDGRKYQKVLYSSTAIYDGNIQAIINKFINSGFLVKEKGIFYPITSIVSVKYKLLKLKKGE